MTELEMKCKEMHGEFEENRHYETEAYNRLDDIINHCAHWLIKSGGYYPLNDKGFYKVFDERHEMAKVMLDHVQKEIKRMKNPKLNDFLAMIETYQKWMEEDRLSRGDDNGQ